MTLNNLLRFLPLAVVACLVFLSKTLDFNALHERGDVGFNVKHPLLEVLLGGVGFEATTTLQVVSWLSAGAAVWLFEQCLRLLSPGTRVESRWTFVILGLALAPFFVWAGLTVMPDALGLALLLAALFFSLKVLEMRQVKAALWMMFFMGLAVTTRFSLVILLAPLALAVGWFLLEQKKWGWLILAASVGFLIFLLKNEVSENLTPPFSLQHWSPTNFFKSSFSNANHSVDYVFPNVLYLLFPLAHPGFCLPLCGLFLLAKKTDIALIPKKLLLICTASYLLLLGGLPQQNPLDLLPAYALLLPLFFPAWDRMFAYGFYFLKRLTLGVIVATFVIQILSSVWIFWKQHSEDFPKRGGFNTESTK